MFPIHVGPYHLYQLTFGWTAVAAAISGILWRIKRTAVITQHEQQVLAGGRFMTGRVQHHRVTALVEKGVIDAFDVTNQLSLVRLLPANPASSMADVAVHHR